MLLSVNFHLTPDFFFSASASICWWGKAWLPPRISTYFLHKGLHSSRLPTLTDCQGLTTALHRQVAEDKREKAPWLLSMSAMGAEGEKGEAHASIVFPTGLSFTLLLVTEPRFTTPLASQPVHRGLRIENKIRSTLIGVSPSLDHTDRFMDSQVTQSEAVRVWQGMPQQWLWLFFIRISAWKDFTIPSNYLAIMKEKWSQPRKTKTHLLRM